MRTLNKIFDSLRIKTPKPYPELKKLVSSYDSQRKAPDILMLGDSVTERISWSDTDKRTLDQMVAQLLENRGRLLCISHQAYNLKVFFYLLQVLKSLRQKPRIIILPINMRSFSPQWDLNPAWQFNNEVDALKNYLETREIPILPTPGSVSFSETERNKVLNYPFTELSSFEEFHNLIANDPSTDEEKFYRKKHIFIFHYLHPLVRTHAKVAYLTEIAELCRELDICLLLYITPINYISGVKHVGSGFIDQIRANTAVIRQELGSFLGNNSVHFLDLSEALLSDGFFHADESTEHLNQYGRMRLAEMIKNEIYLMNAGNGVSPL